MDEARSRGGLRTNYFVRLRKLFLAGRPSLDIRDLGDAEKLLNNRRLLEENARALLKRGVIPTEDGWGGWLGKYQAAMASTANEIGRNRELRSTPSLERRRDRYHPERIAWALRSGARYLDRTGVGDRLIERHFRLLAGTPRLRRQSADQGRNLFPAAADQPTGGAWHRARRPARRRCIAC